jgi:hypothetical protein
MTFWNKPETLDPKRAFRWKVTLLDGNAVGTDVAFLAKKVTKPQFTVEEAEHKFLNKSYYFPGHVKWDPVTVTLVDSRDGALMSKVVAAINAANYETIETGNIPEAQGPLNAGTMKTISKSRLSGATGNSGKVLIQQLDVDGLTIEEWTLHNAWIKSVKPSELSYDTEDLSTYDIELRFDWAQAAGAVSSLDN